MNSFINWLNEFTKWWNEAPILYTLLSSIVPNILAYRSVAIQNEPSPDDSSKKRRIKKALKRNAFTTLIVIIIVNTPNFLASFLNYFTVSPDNIDSQTFTPTVAIVEDYPITSEDAVLSEPSTMCLYDTFSVNGISSNDEINTILMSGNETPISFSSCNNILSFSKWNHRGFQKVYIKGGISITHLAFHINNESYDVVFPSITSTKTVVEIDFKTEVCTEELSLDVISDVGNTPQMVSIWFDKYIYA